MAEQTPPSLFDRLMAVKPDGLSRNAWATNAGLSRTAFDDIRRRNAAKHETIERLLRAIGVTFGEFEAGVRQLEREAPPSAVRQPFLAFRGDERPRDVPILGTAECADVEFGANGDRLSIEAMGLNLDEIVDYARRPVTLDRRREVYAIYFRGDSMAPRYESGELAYVDGRQPPRIRDYVVVQLRAERGGEERVVSVIAKRLVRQSATYIELEQFNPATVFRVDRKMVQHIHRIIPFDELVSF